MADVYISDAASDDLIEIWLYIADDSEAAADRMIDQFHDKFQRLAADPGVGVRRDELGPGLHSFPLKTYLIFYREAADGIEVVRVLSGYRDLDAFF